MKKLSAKEKRALFEGCAILGVGALGVFAIPTLINAHDTIALYAGGFLFIAWVYWIASYFYRNF